jgi:hypothetical protein
MLPYWISTTPHPIHHQPPPLLQSQQKNEQGSLQSTMVMAVSFSIINHYQRQQTLNLPIELALSFSLSLIKQLPRFFIHLYITGSTVAKFSGDTVHFRLRSTAEYQSGDYEAALKRAFLATDEDLRASQSFTHLSPLSLAGSFFPNLPHLFLV